MKLVRWSFMGLYMPMMEDEKGELFCTTKQLTEALAIPGSTLRSVLQRHFDEFDFLSVSKCNAKDFLRDNRVEFGVARVRNDMHLWSEKDMVSVALLSKSTASKAFRTNLSLFIRENATRDLVHVSVLEATRSQMLVDRSVMMEELDRQRGRLDSLQQVIDRFIPASDRAASAAGQMLQARQHALRVIEGGMH